MTTDPGAAVGRERPSRHGMILGQFLSTVAEAGRMAAPKGITPDMCATCAFRDGAMPNQMAATTLAAFNCTMDVDPDDFACHHGMQDGRPTKLCAGYLLAKSAPWSVIKAESAKLRERLDAMSGPDEIRAAFDLWVDKVDPDRALDDYALARLFARAAGRRVLAAETRGGRDG